MLRSTVQPLIVLLVLVMHALALDSYYPADVAKVPLQVLSIYDLKFLLLLLGVVVEVVVTVLLPL